MLGENDAFFSFVIYRQQHMQFKYYAIIYNGFWLGVHINTSSQKNSELHGNIFALCGTTQAFLLLIIVHILNVRKSVGEHNIHFVCPCNNKTYFRILSGKLWNAVLYNDLHSSWKLCYTNDPCRY